MLVMSAHYSRELAQKTRNGLLKRHEQRAFTGGVAAFGFKVVDDDGRKRLAINEAEASVVRDVYSASLGPEPMGLKPGATESANWRFRRAVDRHL